MLMPASSLTSVLAPELRILRWRKIQPDSARSFAEHGFKLLSPSNIQGEAAAFRHFPDLLTISEGQCARQRRLHVIFAKLAMPALPQHKVHKDTLPGGTAAAIAQPLARRWGGGRGELHSQQILRRNVAEPMTPVRCPWQNYSALFRVLFADNAMALRARCREPALARARETCRRV